MSPKEQIDTKRQKAIKTVLFSLAPILGIMALMRFRESGEDQQAFLDLGTMFGSLFFLLLLHYFPLLQRFINRLFLAIALLAFLFTLYKQQGDPSILIWGISVILISFLLNGRMEGWFWTLLTITGVLILPRLSPAYLNELGLFPLITFVGNALLVALLASWYEYLAEKELERIQSEQSRLESLVRQRTRSLHEAKAKAMKALKRAEEASEAKSTFLANVSHEIRTPLNAINGFISMMLKDEENPQKKKQLRTIHEASEILTQLISDILDLSKIESGNMELHYSEFDPRQLFFSVAELYQSRAMEKRIDLHIDFCHHGEHAPLLRSDPMRIRQVLNNLLSNAVKFTPKGGRIHVSACYKSGWLTFTVEDNGIGMSPADQERIFRPFQQVGNRDGNIQGTGLGLTISREIAQRLQGRLDVRSALGVGSTFTFTIPAKRINHPKKTDAITRKKVPEKIDAHLLIVEDVRANQMFITMVLDRHGIGYDIANDGVEAVEMFEKGTYDLILMDENMPRMNGIEATREIRKLEKNRPGSDAIPIIALTANAVTGDRERLLASGMDEYISKPVNPDTLIRTIVTLLGKW